MYIPVYLYIYIYIYIYTYIYLYIYIYIQACPITNLTQPAGARIVQLKSWNTWANNDNNSVRSALLMQAVHHVQALPH